MLTYQLQRRTFHIDEGKGFKFPSDVLIKIVFQPLEPFGARHGDTRTTKRATEGKATYNANNGSATISPAAGLEPISLGVSYPNIEYRFAGNELTVTTHCENVGELEQLIVSLQGTLPALLNLYFYDGPTIERIHGTVGDVAFRWIFAAAQMLFQVTTTENQNNNLAKVIDLYSHICTTQNVRLVAALSYFHRACRLMQAGYGPWEFMAETILNLTKSLEILFGNSRDEIRAGLAAAGVDSTATEDLFIPIVLLRSHFDVGHGRLAMHNFDDLQLIYALLANAEAQFRALFERIATLYRAGKLALQPYDLASSGGYDSVMRGLIERLRNLPASRKTVEAN